MPAGLGFRQEPDYSRQFCRLSYANIGKALVRAANRGVRLTVIVETPDKIEGEGEYSTIKALGQEVAYRQRFNEVLQRLDEWRVAYPVLQIAPISGLSPSSQPSTL